MMKNNKKLITSILAIVIIGATVESAETSQPGSSSDPIVSKSYVDEQINEIKLLLQENNSNQNTDNFSQNQINSILSQINSMQTGNSSMASYVPVSASRGQKIIGEEGTEIILRSGAAVSYSPNSDGIVNATKGLDLKNGEYIGKNNILIVPRSDGRGVSVTSDAWFMVRGRFAIQ